MLTKLSRQDMDERLPKMASINNNNNINRNVSESCICVSDVLTSVSTGFLSDFGTVPSGLYFCFFSPFYYFITPNEHCYQLYHGEYKLHFNDMVMMLD